MRLVMTLKVRDEDDVLEANLRYHFAQGVDFFVVTDNGSTDRTPEILRGYEEAGLLHRIEEPSDDFKRLGGKWVARMIRMAATEFGADWVVNADADEFWWPVSGTLTDAFAGVRDEFDLVYAPRPEFVGRPDGPGSFLDRLVFREAVSRLRPKLACRAAPDLWVGRGSHHARLVTAGDEQPPVDARSRHPGRAVLRAVSTHAEPGEQRLIPSPRWPLRILHMPLRSFEQYRRRVEVILFHGAYARRRRHSELESHYREGRLAELYERLVLDDAAVREGLRTGRLVEDRGVRDFLSECPDPLSAGGPDAARAWAAARPRSAAREAQDVAANELDMMQALVRTERSQGRRRKRARDRVRRVREDRNRLRERLRAVEDERDRLAGRVAASESTPLRRARAAASRALRRIRSA